MTVDKPTPGNLIATVSELVDAENAGGGIPAAVPFTTTTMSNPIAGGDMTVIILPVDSPILAVALEGDAFPRLLINADPGNFETIAMGDGTVDPSGGAAATIGYSLGNIILNTSQSVVRIGGDGIFLDAGAITSGVGFGTTKLGFYNTNPVTQPNGLDAGAALESLGLAANVIPPDLSNYTEPASFHGQFAVNDSSGYTNIQTNGTNAQLALVAPDVGSSVYIQAPTISLTGAVQLSLDAQFNSNRGPVLVSPGGTSYRIKVADNGALSTELVV